MSYDSTEYIEKHRRNVRYYMDEMMSNLTERMCDHDKSKLQPPEKEMFDKSIPQLKELEYGTPEYKQALEDMGPGLAHHYENNSHHPEHFDNGIWGMSLLDLVEMFCDWRAAFVQNSGKDFVESIDRAQDRFGISDQLCKIFLNTLEEMR